MKKTENYSLKNVFGRAMAIAVPMMIQNGITNAVGLVDNVMVGSLGSEAITAVSIVGQLIFVFNLGIFGGLSGPAIYGAQYFGQKNIEGFRDTVRIKHWIGLAVLLAGLAAFIFGGGFLINLYLKGESEEIDPELTMRIAKQYLGIMLWGLPPFVITQIFAGSLRETGSAVKPMIAGVVSVVVDIVGNWLLIYGNLNFPKMEARGAALATVIARFAELIVLIILMYSKKKKHEFLSGLYKRLTIPRETAGKLIGKSLPIFFNEFLWAAGIAILTQIYSQKGIEIVAGLNISNALCNLLNVVFVALGSAVGIIVGQALGASEYLRAKKEAFALMWFTGGISALLTVILIAFSEVFPNAYETSEAVKNYASEFIVVTALFFPVQGFLNALYFTLRSGGKTLVTFLFDSVYSWVVGVPVAAALCAFTDIPVLYVYAIVQALDLVKVAIGCILINKGVWVSNIVEKQ
ncbi:MAG: MATE family efflux transporter [Oscillospiraceae bacterium]|nr:MATE family efflux transporter [Oscillospiraceae bacterium]